MGQFRSGRAVARAVRTDLPRNCFCSDFETLVGQEGVGDERHGCRPSGRWGGEVSLHSVVVTVGEGGCQVSNSECVQHVSTSARAERAGKPRSGTRGGATDAGWPHALTRALHSLRGGSAWHFQLRS